MTYFILYKMENGDVYCKSFDKVGAEQKVAELLKKGFYERNLSKDSFIQTENFSVIEGICIKHKVSTVTL